MALRLRTSTQRRNDKTYEYFQLVRAVRKNGKPTHEVVAHLGRLREEEAEALRWGLQALKIRGKPSKEEVRVKLRDITSRAALRYLDVMVVHSLWQEWGLPGFFEEHLPTAKAVLPPADVVETLVANRCLAPCSKLRVTEWTPRTALPEILGFRPDRLNNTRIHRVLEGLEEIEPALTRFLVAHPKRRQQADSVVFLDLTSTWFTGRGGDLAGTARTKEGAIRRRVVQIALAVDEYGFPLRWELLPGRTCEAKVLPSWIQAIGELEELDDLPLCFDRGLATEDNLVSLLFSGRRFVTCARKPKIEDWAVGVDLEAIANTPDGEMPSREVLEEAGLWPTQDDDLYTIDYGVRLPVGMEHVPAPGLRVVLYFRRTLFARHRQTTKRTRARILAKVEAINTDLSTAKKSRNEAKTRKKVDALLMKYSLQQDYRARLEPLELPGKTRPIRSFKVHLDPIDNGTQSRDFNAGWMVVLAHPDDERPTTELVGQYHNKEAVEHAFKTIKSFVDLHPIRHQTTPKIKAHVTLCVLGLLIDRTLEFRLRQAGISDEIDRAYEMLEPCRLQVLSCPGRGPNRYTTTDIDSGQRRLLRALGLSHLSDQEVTDSLYRCRY
jgi:transposase